LPDVTFSDWEAILSEIVVGDEFGVDRIDYLLRDSYHTGVAYGRFDHYRLVDTLRILTPPAGPDGDGSTEPSLGVEEGGVQSAEALLLARYFMYSQVYFHPIRRIYDIHLKDFLSEWLTDGKFSTDLEKHLALTDNEVTAALRAATDDAGLVGHLHAERIMKRSHFKVAYQRNPEDVVKNPEASSEVFAALKGKYGKDNVRYDEYMQKGGVHDFHVLKGCFILITFPGFEEFADSSSQLRFYCL